MTDRARVQGFRIPRRLQRGVVQRPHPVTKRREDAERHRLWVEGGGPGRLVEMFKSIYAASIVNMMPSEGSLSEGMHFIRLDRPIGLPLAKPRFPEPE